MIDKQHAGISRGNRRLQRLPKIDNQQESVYDFRQTVKGKRDYYGNQYTFNETDCRIIPDDPDGVHCSEGGIIKRR